MTWWRRRYAWAIVALVGVLVGNLGGLAIGDDGVGYQAVADNLRSGSGLGYFLEPELTIWPPGWPALMAFVSRVTGYDSEQAAIILNAITAAVLVVLVNRLLHRLVRSDLLVLAGTAVSAIGASSMVFGHLLMTDMAFAAITLGVLLAAMNYRESANPRWLAATCALVGASFMVRYAGIITIATVAAWFAISDAARTPAATRLRNAALFGVGAAIVPVAWILRNLSIDDTVLGVRYGSARGLLPNTVDTVATIGNFLLPGVAIELRVIWAIVAILGTGAMVAMLWRLARFDERLRSPRGLLALAGTGAGLLVVHLLGYLVYMLYARTTTGLNQLDFRLLNPAYLPLIITALVILDRVQDTPGPRWPVAARTLAVLWAAVNLAVGVAMVVYFSTAPDLFGGNYERAAYDAARGSRALDSLDPGCEYSSNAPNALYAAGVEVDWSPRVTGPESNDPVDDLDRLRSDLAQNRRRCLIWIDLEPRWGHLASLERLRKEFTLERQAADDRVTTYEIVPRVTPGR